MREDIGKGDDVRLAESSDEVFRHLLAKKCVQHRMPGGGCIRGRAGRLDAKGPGTTLGKDRQQAAVIAADIQYLLASEIAVLFNAGIDQTPHAVQHVKRLARPVVIGRGKQVLLWHLKPLMRRAATIAE